ncbi:MAG: amino acid permease [Gemmatimonadetes bacterium]|nr:amino acid permease [Gemmatimonadota bacterium]
MPDSNPPAAAPQGAGYDRRLGTFDAVMVVVGAIIGAGIFLNPAIVAQRVGTSALVLAAWGLGGAIAVVGALCFAELGARLPRAGGGYVYLRDAFGPLPAFLYGWTQLLVINTGGIAAVAITFATYAADLAGAGPTIVKPLAVAAIVFLSAVNAAGVRFGTWVQNAFTLLKLAALALLVGAGAWLLLGGRGAQDAAGAAAVSAGAASAAPSGAALVLATGTALVAVLFAYGGWQHANNIAEEIREPERRLPLALLVGVGIVVAVYVSANAAYLTALGPRGLATSAAPAADALRTAAGRWGGVAIAAGIACSTFGILNVFIMTVPRIYQAMAADGVFFASVARLSARTRTPVVGIWIQMAWAVVLALSGTYGQLLDWVVFGDWIFFGMIVATLFVYRARDLRSVPMRAPADGSANAAGRAPPARSFRAPWHPVLPALFVVAAVFVVASSVVSNPRNAIYGTLLIAAGVPAYLGWASRRRGGGGPGSPGPGPSRGPARPR